ncbi:Transcriptional regulator protein (SplA) [Bacillus sp. THAF10]|uniref:transcriptional regulator SplA domain-containing protein n=1 Tax=Bacillus sp. THAF10 TaxID=2587848 RepID=UPI001268108F|nr:transcriptional regulator SplA domain-containing protein [Bacillus sp. THAF10]QFT88474.1 Transcriptional regulator protein (SplA) [Bacillus sp. THAF10]
MDIYPEGNASSLQEGDTIYLFYRNPHTQNVATIQQASIVSNPYDGGKLAMFLYDTYYPLSDEFVFFTSLDEAEALYNDYFGPTYD